jgi:Flp pilus assembly protein TadG
LVVRGLTVIARRIAESRLASFARANGGATAVEFALVALPFLTMIFALLELGVIFLISMTLDDATMTAARQIRTGQLQTAGGASNTQAGFQTLICANMTWITTCSSDLYVDVETYPSFTTASPANPVTGGTFNAAALGYNPGTAQSVVVVRSYFRWKLITPFLDQALEKLSDGEAVITSTATFRNEPYS